MKLQEIKKQKVELSKLSVQDLKSRIIATEESLAKMKLSNKVTPLENPIVITDTRKSVARLHTELTKRQNQA
jgi:large subunit ribosomal protein L29